MILSVGHKEEEYIITWASKMLVLMVEGWTPVNVYKIGSRSHADTIIMRRKVYEPKQDKGSRKITN